MMLSGWQRVFRANRPPLLPPTSRPATSIRTVRGDHASVRAFNQVGVTVLIANTLQLITRTSHLRSHDGRLLSDEQAVVDTMVPE